MAHFILVLISLLPISTGYREGDDSSITYRKFVYQKDMSHYCRRRVMPSVFLGRQVVEANAQILHFSRLESPYSCYVNVRTEMGSNIIVVIQVITDIDIEKTCQQGDNQLLIYELGETFGGYWGQLPDSVMKKGTPRDDRLYTLKTTQSEPTTVDAATESSTTTSTTKTPSTTKKNLFKQKYLEDEREYLTVELPIVNVSAQMLPGQLPVDLAFSTEDNFDMLYDVAPWSDVPYDTSMLPLLEVAVESNKARLRDGGKVQEVSLGPEFQVQFNDLFTPDPRLTLPEFDAGSYKRKSYKYQPVVNRRLSFRKHKHLFDPKDILFNKKRLLKYRRPKLNRIQSYMSKLSSQPSIKHDDETEHNINTWAVLHDILNNLTKVNGSTTQPPHKELANILRGISNRQFNKSVYLIPDLSHIDVNTSRASSTSEYGLQSVATTKSSVNNTTKFFETNDTWRQSSVSQDSNKSLNNSNALGNNESVIIKDAASIALLPIALDVDSIILNVTNQNNSIRQYLDKSPKTSLGTQGTTSASKFDPLTVSLVDHESWENLVNAAPVMAVKLNQSKVSTVDDAKKATNVTKPNKNKVRKKRYIHSIDIEIANPHHVQVMKHMTTTPTPEKFDMREFQRLIELQDDEIYDRVAMRYLRQYVGLPLLNFCDFNDTSTRHVYLFNSSRLVLALSNFTLKRMTVVLTPARTLLHSDAHCSNAHLECQVSGARVCIDSHSACDGVPNCGSYDIYDEDRLRCGAAAGLRHNVCLAAITFLAVLLTILYTIHYWLKRCVPRVSDAFFIYTDAAENVLYLEPVMRSPHDVGVGKEFFRGAMQQFMEYEDIVVKHNMFSRFFNRCMVSLRRKRRKVRTDIVEAELDNLYSQRLSNYVDMDLNRIVPYNMFHSADVAVQTDSSLEVDVLEVSPSYSKEVLYEQDNMERSSTERAEFMRLDSDSNQPSDELSILKFFRKARKNSTNLQITSDEDEIEIKEMSARQPSILEKEIEFHEYNPNHYSMDQGIMADLPIKIDVDKEKPGPSVRKHLRFQEDAVIIPFPSEGELDEENVEITPNNRRSIVFGANKVFRIQESEPIEPDEPVGGAAREFKSYFNWGSGKEKKKKKPKKK